MAEDTTPCRHVFPTWDWIWFHTRWMVPLTHLCLAADSDSVVVCTAGAPEAAFRNRVSLTHFLLTADSDSVVVSIACVAGAREAAFRNIKTIGECLADELINAAKGSSNRWASDQHSLTCSVLGSLVRGALHVKEQL